MKRIGLLHSLLRKDEKLLIEEFKKYSNLELILIDDRKIFFSLKQSPVEVDSILERCINHSRALHSLRIFESFGVKCFNSYSVANICGDKLLTSYALKDAGVRQPDLRIAFTEHSALEAIEELGYPVVFKPAVGSLGRLISQVSDKASAEAIIEHKTILGSYHHSIFYIQKYIEKKHNRDIRTFIIGDEVIAAIYRYNNHWITNTARGAIVEKCPLNSELIDISLSAAKAVGGGILAVDLFEDTQGYLVNEVNYTMEFKNSIEPTKVNIPQKICDYVLNNI